MSLGRPPGHDPPGLHMRGQSPAAAIPPGAFLLSTTKEPCSHYPISASWNRLTPRSPPSGAPVSTAPDASQTVLPPRRGAHTAMPPRTPPIPHRLPEPWHSCRLLRQPSQRVISQQCQPPLVEEFSSQRLVELDGLFI